MILSNAEYAQNDVNLSNILSDEHKPTIDHMDICTPVEHKKYVMLL